MIDPKAALAIVGMVCFIAGTIGIVISWFRGVAIIKEEERKQREAEKAEEERLP